MGGLFGGSDPEPLPPPPAPAPVPTMDTARSKVQQDDERAMRRGRAATILTSASGDLNETKSGAKTLLGG